jgi:hypothetical protein
VTRATVVTIGRRSDVRPTAVWACDRFHGIPTGIVHPSGDGGYGRPERPPCGDTRARWFGGGLTPFTNGDPVAAAGHRKGNATLREMAALQRASITDARALLSDLVATHPREQLGPTAAALAQSVIAEARRGVAAATFEGPRAPWGS